MTLAKKTIDKTRPFSPNTEVMLFGIACTNTKSGLLATLTSLKDISIMITLTKPSLLAIIPNIPASISANTDVPKNPNIVL